MTFQRKEQDFVIYCIFVLNIYTILDQIYVVHLNFVISMVLVRKNIKDNLHFSNDKLK